MRRLQRTFGFSAVLLLFLAGPAAAQTPPSTLTGELFIGSPTVTSNCNTTGVSTISYSVSGVATGPYSGPFFASGIATIGPQPLPGFFVPLTGFTETFTIDSPAGFVTGTKTLFRGSNLAPNAGRCTDFDRNFGAGATYEATIRTATGTFRDRGQTLVALNEPGLGGVGGEFIESFFSDLQVPEPVPEPVARVTGGGSLGQEAFLGLDVERSVEGEPARGQVQFVNHLTGDIVHSVEITDFVVTGNTAVIVADCRNSASEAACELRITVNDNGEGGDGVPDTVTVTGEGFTGAAGPLDGNIAIHTE
jgi:hypothetical protein